MDIRVFIVDDSAVVRKVLREILDNTPGICVIGAAQDPIFAQHKLKKEWPDVIVLDVNMPRMDGISFLAKIMIEHPTPVVMCSLLTAEGSATSLKALRMGAIDVVEKPRGDIKTSLVEASQKLISAIRTAAKANVGSIKQRSVIPVSQVTEKLTADVMLSKVGKASPGSARTVIAIGASTGGTRALEAILTVVEPTSLPILIVQHMPAAFTGAFAKRLNEICSIEVREAVDNDELVSGCALIAPGGKHLMLQATATQTRVRVLDGPLVCRHKPSVDVLFRSVAKYAATNSLGIILTGMGDDGARGMLEMHDVGASTIAQNKESCIVHGMPKEAVKLGAVDHEMALDRIPAAIESHYKFTLRTATSG